jgi:hypothetical protein
VRWAKVFSDKRNETNVPDADHSAHLNLAKTTRSGLP